MDRDENRIFFNEVAFIHFPALATYMKQASIDPVATVDAWQMTLRDVTTQEALSVIHRWTKDELPRPAYLELADFALHLRAVVLKDRADRRKSVVIDSIKDRGDNPTSFSQVKLGPYFKRIFESGEKYKAGTISLEEHKTLCDQVIAEHSQAIKKERYQ